MQSKQKTVAEYLASLPADRRTALDAVRDVILRNLDPGYAEGMQYGMIGYFVPHGLFPAGYHCDPKQPLPFAGLASQKNHMSIHLMAFYSEGTDHLSTWFREAWRDTGKKLDMGTCCVRFKKVEDLALDVLAEAIRRLPVKKYVEHYTHLLAQNAARKAKGAGRPTAKPKPKEAAKPKPKAKTGGKR